MQTAYDIGAGNATEALDQADYLMQREPDYYHSIEFVIDSYADNAAQTESITTAEDWDDMARGFLDVLARAGITHRPHGF